MGKQLIIAEKASAAREYAKALKCDTKGKGYVENDKFIITWAVGHLFMLKEPEDYNEKYKTWCFEDLPIIPEKFYTKMIDEVKGQYFVIKSLIEREDVSLIINGGDCAVEGELVQRWIIYNTRTKKPVKRLWIDDLQAKTIIDGVNNLHELSEFDQYYHAANTRSKIDWLLGLNFTRAYTTKLGGKVTLSVGRCQTCVLNLIVERDREIENFKSEPFYEIIADFIDFKGKFIDFSKEKDGTRIFDKIEAENIIKSIKLKKGTILKVKKEEKSKKAPSLYNLSDLKKVMFNKYGFNEEQTTKLAQSLYENHKILSYPRTDSNHLTEALAEEFDKRLELLSFGEFNKIINNIDKVTINKVTKDKYYVDNKKVSDHYALIPTDNEKIADIYQTLSNDEKQLFDEIVLRFLAIFYGEYRYESTEIISLISGYNFKTTGKREIDLGWKKIYKDDEEELKESSINADLKEGQDIIVQEANISEGKTKPPAYYNTATLIGAMQKFNIGTEATRDNFTKTLLKRNYITRDEKHIKSTKLGKFLIDTISLDEIKSVEYTAKLEEKLNLILRNKIKPEEVFQEAKEMMISNIEALKNIHYEPIKIQEEVLGKCPKCKVGNVVERKTFYGCNRYEEGCKFGLKKEIAGGNISVTQMRKLLEKNRTDLISFKSEKGSFKARLTYNTDTEKIDFLYDNKKRKR